MLGRKLAARLATDGCLADAPVAHLILVDAPSPRPAAEAPQVESIVADLSEPDTAADLVSRRPDVIFHLAAIVSGEAESDFERGYCANVDGTRLLPRRGSRGRSELPSADHLRIVHRSVRITIPPGDRRRPLPDAADELRNSEAIAELLLSDYTRRGFLDGIGIRLPTICVRPGRPNLAASGFFSSIIREPLNGEAAVLPVPDSVRHWHASPRAAVGFLLHAATVDDERLGTRRCLTMPGVSVTVAGQIESLRRIAGDGAVGLIRREPDESVMRIVAGWPSSFDTRRATALGFRADVDFDEIVQVHVQDELGGVIPLATR